MGPISTREMFPLYLPTLAYQPVDPTPVGQGRWRVALDTIRANTTHIGTPDNIKIVVEKNERYTL